VIEINIYAVVFTIKCLEILKGVCLCVQGVEVGVGDELKLEFGLHDDSSLPSIPEQLQRFANASIVIGPHGAGMANIVASKRRTKDKQWSTRS
jgi:hypothetical protein